MLENAICEGISTHLDPLVERLKQASSWEEKERVLTGSCSLQEIPILQGLLPHCPLEDRVALLALGAIGQAPHILSPFSQERLEELLASLRHVETFYAPLGGIVGYQREILRLQGNGPRSPKDDVTYHSPPAIDISLDTQEVRRAILASIAHLGQMAEIYPVGGAADRLRPLDEKSGNPLAAALLFFCGETLLGRLICDLQAREYLHYKLFGVQLTTPIALMTSEEKGNHEQICTFLEKSKWFGRSSAAFRLFSQPSVPVVDKKGKWIVSGPMQLLLRPGGHGVIWKLARDKGIFRWFGEQLRKKALLRQINNPIAGTDYGLLAFTGIGCKRDKIFGFASCPREVGSHEGMNVLVQQGEMFVLRNIEYCDFQKYQIPDVPITSKESTSRYPSNTNILFAVLSAIESVLEECPIPGMLVNCKKTAYTDVRGALCEVEGARLESTMQNIADLFTSKDPQELAAFLTYNARRKTISCAKREYMLGGPLLETPEGAFLDYLHNAKELLVEHCRIALAENSDFLFLYHPALGPLYSVIGQKIRGGRFGAGAELQLRIAELDLEALTLEGSLLIEAENPLGHFDAQGILHYSNSAGKCTLKNVRVHNRGIDKEAQSVFWKGMIPRKEACRIYIRGDGEFCAENVELVGNLEIEVPKGVRLRAIQEGGKLLFQKEPLSFKRSWSWKYFLGPDTRICLARS